jgi:hypothetical protein
LIETPEARARPESVSASIPFAVAKTRTNAAVHWLILILISAAFTAMAIRRLFDMNNGGTFGGMTEFLFRLTADPPHSLFSCLMAVLAFALFGIHPWAPYLLNGLIVLALLKIVDRFMEDLPLWQRLCGYGLVLATQFPGVCVTEFKPDMAWGIACAAAIIGTLHRPISAGNTSRFFGIGIFWGAAMVIKSSTIPVTGAMYLATIVLPIACEWRDGAEARKTARNLGIVLLVSILVATPYYSVAARQTAGYFLLNATGGHKQWWAIPGGFSVQARYYFDGLASQFMLGWHLWVLLGAAAAGAVVAWFRKPAARLRIVSLAIVTFIAYLIPTIPEVKGLTLGAAFDAMLLLLAILGIRQIFLLLAELNQRWLTCAFTAILIAFIIPFEWRSAMWTAGDSVATAFNRTSSGIMQCILDDSQGDTAYITVANEGNVTGYVPLQFRAYEMTLPFTFGNLEPYFNPQASAPRMRVANYVVASEPDNPDFQAFLPTSVAAGDILNWIRQSGEFDEIGSFPSQSGRRFFVFANRLTGFGGYDAIDGLTTSFPADLRYPLGVYRAGLHHSTELRVLGGQPAEKILKIAVYNNFHNQRLTVALDGHVLVEKNIPADEITLDHYQAFEVPLHLSAGSHTIHLYYTQCDPVTGWPAVIFRQLKIVPNPAAVAATRPVE